MTNLKSKLSPLIISFSLGLFVMFLSLTYLKENKHIPNKLNQCYRLSKAQTKLISISENEYLEYTQIKDQKEKYEKADELLGKIMILFLADLGFRFKKSNPIAQQEISNSDENKEKLSLPNKNNSNHQNIDFTNQGKQILSDESSQTAKPLTSEIINILESEKKINEILDQSILDNPKIESSTSLPIDLKKGKIFAGLYNGYIKFIDTQKEDHIIIWDLRPDESKNEFSGSFTLKIQGPGRNSESNGTGNIENIVNLAKDPNGYLISSCSDNCFLQLYYNSSTGQFFGNFYETTQSSVRKPVRTGYVVLKR